MTAEELSEQAEKRSFGMKTIRTSEKDTFTP